MCICPPPPTLHIFHGMSHVTYSVFLESHTELNQARQLTGHHRSRQRVQLRETTLRLKAVCSLRLRVIERRSHENEVDLSLLRHCLAQFGGVVEAYVVLTHTT